MNLELFRQLDQWGGRLATPAASLWLRVAQRPVNAQPRRILIIKLWGLGSVTLSLPLVQALREAHPAAEIVYLTVPGHVALLKRVSAVDRVITVDIGSPGRAVLGLVRRALELAAGHFDQVYDLEFFAYSASLLAAATGAPLRVGMMHPHRRFDIRESLYSRLLDVSPVSHVAAVWRSMAGVPLGEPVAFPPLSNVTPEAVAGDGPLIVINPNASALALERRWPAKRFAALADALIEHRGARVHFIGVAGEHGHVEAVMAAMRHGGQAVNRAGAFGLGGLLSLMAAADLVITNDSGPLHLASALGRPTVAFFGPETPGRYGPLAPRQLTFYLGVPCSPCMRAEDLKRIRCGYEQRCLRELSAEDVIDAVLGFMQPD